MRAWTDQEISTLVSMWPTTPVVRIANTLHRSTASVSHKAKLLRKEGLLESKKARRNKFAGERSTTNPINPDLQDFDAVKREYCRKHQITIAELCTRFEGDSRLAAELYRLAQAAKQTRLRSRLVGLIGGDTPPGTGSSPLSAPSANGALTGQRRP